jgi:hypothetical protein
MNSLPELNRVLRLAGIPVDRSALHPPQLEPAMKPVPVVSAMGNRAFLRAWAARRAAYRAAASGPALVPETPVN